MNPKFNYAEAIQKSYLFYKSMQAGKLPEDHSIPWRGDSALNDGADVGRDLSGGYYTSSTHVKFGFPMASSMTMLAWGVEAFDGAYETIGQKDEALDAIKWGTDYILNAYDDKGTEGIEDDVFYGQVGQESVVNSFWGAPEEMTMERVTYKIDAQNPGTELAAESASALASASIIFRNSDPAYADKLLAQAKKLYSFGETYLENYHKSITDADPSYQSYSGYVDELAWGASWLHKATKAAGATDPQYLEKAEQYFNDNGGIEGGGWTHDWDGKMYGTAVLLAQESEDPKYKNQVEGWLDRWLIDKADGGIPEITEGGFAWMAPWASFRYTANTAMLASVYADTVNDKDGKYSKFVEQQINYMLGDNPNDRSYVVGFGENSPQNPHHRGAHASPTNNIEDGETKNVLYGALVGGLTEADDNIWRDDRNNDLANSVTLDFNAGYTGALAFLTKKYGGTPLPDSEISKLYPVNFSVMSDWGKGFQGEVKVTNTGDYALSDWTVEFELENEITNIWNAQIVSREGNKYVISAADSRGNVAPGQQVTWGFVAEGSLDGKKPYAFDFKGELSGTIGEVVAQSGGEFDENSKDFDILLTALEAADLTGAVSDPSADLTVFAPTDAAFIKLAQDFGYEGSDEAGAFGAVVDALTDLGGGDPIPVLQDVLKYHVSAGAKTLEDIKGTEAIDTLLEGATITPNKDESIIPNPYTLEDKEPELTDPGFVAGATDLSTENGIIQGIDRVMIPLDIPGNKPFKAAEIFSSEQFQYGKVEVRMKAAEAEGVISNFFVYKDDSWQADTFHESFSINVLGKDGADTWQSKIVSGQGNSDLTSSEQVHDEIGGLADEFHTYTVEWKPGSIEWKVDDRVIRSQADDVLDQAKDINNPASLRFNFWNPDVVEQFGEFAPDSVPLNMFVNWVKYYPLEGNSFADKPTWTDNFDTLDDARWGKANWSFGGNQSDFTPDNANAKNGFLVLSITEAGQTGYDGTPTEDIGEGIRINAGGQAFTDTDGNHWDADKYFMSGTSAVGADETIEDSLLETEHSGNSFSYAIPVGQSGTYQVTLMFDADDSSHGTFDVSAEGMVKIGNLDLVAETNVQGIVEKTFEVTLEEGDNVLDLSFDASANNLAEVSAIAVSSVA